MAAYIPVPRDLTRVKSKILFNLTKRQLLCFGAGALIGVPSFFLLKADGNTSMASICMILIMMPFFFLGMYERDGQPLEKIAKQFIQAKFVRPKVRPYQTNNYYAVLLRQAQAEMEVKNIVYDEKSVPKGRKKRSEHAEESDEGAGTVLVKCFCNANGFLNCKSFYAEYLASNGVLYPLYECGRT